MAEIIFRQNQRFDVVKCVMNSDTKTLRINLSHSPVRYDIELKLTKELKDFLKEVMDTPIDA